MIHRIDKIEHVTINGADGVTFGSGSKSVNVTLNHTFQLGPIESPEVAKIVMAELRDLVANSDAEKITIEAPKAITEERK